MVLPIKLADIQPQVAAPESDRFSRNLYNWVRRHQHSHGARIYCTQRDYEGKPSVFDYAHADRSDIFIGFERAKFIYGAPIRSIQIGHKHSGEYGSHLPDAPLEITEWFWENYIKRGRCLMDAQHDKSLMYDKDRYSLAGNLRVCRWCGVRQLLNTRVVQVTKEEWVCV